MKQDQITVQYTYSLVKEEYFLSDESRIAYGIAVFADTSACGSGCMVASISDITPDRATAERLVRRCNEGGLSPDHLADVVDDLLAEEALAAV